MGINSNECSTASLDFCTGYCGDNPTFECKCGKDSEGDDACYVCQTGLMFESETSFNCVDENECAADPGPCDENQVCENKWGSYTCGKNRVFVKLLSKIEISSESCFPNFNFPK